MLIICKLQRDTEFPVTLDDTTYIFRRNSAGDQVVEVKNNAHIKTFLAIDGYDIYDPDETDLDETDEVDIEGDDEDQDDAGQTTEPTSAAPIATDPAPKEPATAKEPETEPDEPATEPELPADPSEWPAYDDMTDEQVKAAYKVKMGKAPHHNAKIETLIDQMEQADEEAQD